MLKEFIKEINDKISSALLLKIVLALVILFLVMLTDSVWGSWIALLVSILKPFFYGFALAYVIHPFIDFLESKGIRRNLGILAFWIFVFVGTVLLAWMIVPTLYERIISFMDSMIMGVEWIFTQLTTLAENNSAQSIFSTIEKTLVGLLNESQKLIPDVASSIPNILKSFMNGFTTAVVSFVISIYFLFDFQKVKTTLRLIFQKLWPGSETYLHVIDDNVIVYIKSMLIVMFIKLVEYSLFYYLFGHQDWAILGILTSIGLIIPYFGATLANFIGILTALTLPVPKIILMIIGICILANIDAYVISPLVHQKRSDVGPLMSLLAVFVGGNLLGAIGIMLSMPVAVAIKGVKEYYDNQKKAKASL